jgi:hypothetical protein
MPRTSYTARRERAAKISASAVLMIVILGMAAGYIASTVGNG